MSSSDNVTPISGKRDQNPEYAAYRQSERWNNLRRAVKLRAKGKCEICHRGNGTDLAHLTYERIFNERMTDVLWLCRECHLNLDEPGSIR